MNVGLIFGIIFAAIVIGLLLFFGVRYIGETSQMACKSQAGQQLVSLENAVRSTMSMSKGTLQELKILVPSCIDKICFINADHPEIENKAGKWTPTEFLITYIDANGYNVILINPSGTVEGKKMENIKQQENFCLDSTKKIMLSNEGTFIDILPPE